jgi:hypothetical protein
MQPTELSINRYFGLWLIIRWIESESGAGSELLVRGDRAWSGQ